MTTEGKLNHVLKKLISIILVALIVYSLALIVNSLWSSTENAQLQEELRETYKAGKGPEKNLASPMVLEPLLKINPDVVGWIYIDGTPIDYPVVQAEDNVYYLRKNIRKEYALPGSIFMDYRNNPQGKEQHRIIYGHHMKDGSMFQALNGYKDPSFLAQHPQIILETLDGPSTWQIFSMYVTDTEFDYIQTEFADEGEFTQFLAEITQRSLHPTGISVSSEDEILTLSTCTYEFKNARFTVHAKRVG